MKNMSFFTHKTVTVIVTTTVIVLITLSGPVLSQNLTDDSISKQEQARSIERDIVALEQQLSKANKDKVAISKRLEDVEKRILDCYMVLDTAESELACSRKSLNSDLRYLYVEGRRDTLVHLLNSNDASDFLVHLDHVIDVTAQEAYALKDIKAKKERVKQYQDNLITFKNEEASLSRGVNAEALEVQIGIKKEELADVTSSIIAMQLPVTQAPAPTTFSPSQVFSEPDDSGFITTGQVISGYSSWYGNEFHGRTTASGEVFDQYAFTCAHKQLPFGTWLRVTFRGRTIIVKVNDRGPFIKGRMLDLSRGAAEALGLSGVQWVDCEIVVPR